MEKGVITLLDVLGWKGIWQRRPDAIDSLTKILQRAQNMNNHLFSSDKLGQTENLFKGIKTDVVSISDTIAIVSYGDLNKLIECHAILSTSVTYDSIIEGIPVRGAICCGEISTKDHIFVGPAVDEVASWYEAVEWIGTILTPSALLQYKPTDTLSKNAIVKHNVTAKGIGSYETLCPNWTLFWGKGDEELKKQFASIGPIFPDIAQKINNTLDFYNRHKVKVK